MKGLKHLGFAAALAWPVPVEADDLVVFAAASLKGPLDAIAADFGDVRVAYGGSGTLARQVQQGAPADVVLLAHVEWMDVLVEAGSVSEPQVFAGNRLVIIGPESAGDLALAAPAIAEALDGGRLAMGFTAAVPAGIYGKAALISLGLWDDLQRQIAEVDSVRAAVALVARGEAPLGVVYQSDATLIEGVAVRAMFPAESHAPIEYWGAVVSGSDHPDAAGFLVALTEAEGVLAEAGFCPAAGCAE